MGKELVDFVCSMEKDGKRELMICIGKELDSMLTDLDSSTSQFSFDPVLLKTWLSTDWLRSDQWNEFRQFLFIGSAAIELISIFGISKLNIYLLWMS